MFRKIAFTAAAIGLIGSTSAALAAPTIYQTQNARGEARQRAEDIPTVQSFVPHSDMAQDSRLQVYVLGHGLEWKTIETPADTE